MTEAKLHTVALPFPDKDDRKIWVYVPQHNDGEKLPVIYMTDGQNLFDENSTPYGSWGVVDALTKEKELSGKTAIIVGVDNGNIWRDSELTPKSIGKVQHAEELNEYFTPQGEIFDRFLTDTVMPYVEEHFPVLTDRSNTSVCGSSSGGLQAFFTGMEHKEKFAYIGALSPAFLLYNEEDWTAYLSAKNLFDDADGHLPYVYMYSGSADDLEERIYASTEMVYDMLSDMCYPYDKLNEVILLENMHNEKSWKEIFPDFLHTALNR